MNDNPAPSALDPDFRGPRPCLRKPVPEIFEAADLLDKAVDAHLAGEHGKAGSLIAEANMPEVRDWVESLWGQQVSAFIVSVQSRVHRQCWPKA